MSRLATPRARAVNGHYRTGRDPRCADCTVYCGYEATAVMDAMSSPEKAARSVWAAFVK